MPTQSTDVVSSPYGIAYTAANQTWKILKGVSVQGDSAGVYSAYANSKLINNGSILGEVAVYFMGSGGTSDYVVENQKKGEINGEYGVVAAGFLGSLLIDNAGEIGGLQFGIYVPMFDAAVKIVNTGEVDGGAIGFYSVGSGAVSIENHGEISGGQAGVAMQMVNPDSPAPKIDNYGTIKGFQAGVYLLGDVDGMAKVINHKGAKIESPEIGILSQDGLKVVNQGKIEGHILTGDSQDKVINKGKISGYTALGGDDDVFKSSGKNAKAGILDTGGGNDLVVLGKNADKLLFNTELNALTNVDTVKKFESGKDKFYLDDDVFSTITPGTLSSSAFHKGTSAADADDRIIYDKKSGALYYDPDGVGGVGQTQFAKLDGGPKLKAGDFTVGEYSLPLV